MEADSATCSVIPVRTLCAFGGVLCTAGDDGSVCVWDVEGGTCTAKLQGHMGWVLALCSLGGLLCSAGEDRSVRVWDLEKKTCTTKLEGHTGWVLALCALGGVLCSAGDDGSVRLWDVERGTCTAKLEGHKGYVRALCALRGVICSTGYDGSIKVWHVEKRMCTAKLEGHQGYVLALCAVESVLCSAGEDGSVRVWDVERGTCTAKLDGHTGYVLALCALGGVLCSAGCDGSVMVWNVARKTCTAKLEGHTGRALALCALGDVLCSAGEDGSVKLWDVGDARGAAAPGVEKEAVEEEAASAKDHSWQEAAVGEVASAEDHSWQEPAVVEVPSAKDPSRQEPAVGEVPSAKDPSWQEPAVGEVPSAKDPSWQEPAVGEVPPAKDPSWQEPAVGEVASAKDPVWQEPAVGEVPSAKDPSWQEPAVGEVPSAKDPFRQEPAVGEVPPAKDPSRQAPAVGEVASAKDPSWQEPAVGEVTSAKGLSWQEAAEKLLKASELAALRARAAVMPFKDLILLLRRHAPVLGGEGESLSSLRSSCAECRQALVEAQRAIRNPTPGSVALADRVGARDRAVDAVVAALQAEQSYALGGSVQAAEAVEQLSEVLTAALASSRIHQRDHPELGADAEMPGDLEASALVSSALAALEAFEATLEESGAKTNQVCEELFATLQDWHQPMLGAPTAFREITRLIADGRFVKCLSALPAEIDSELKQTQHTYKLFPSGWLLAAGAAVLESFRCKASTLRAAHASASNLEEEILECSRIKADCVALQNLVVQMETDAKSLKVAAALFEASRKRRELAGSQVGEAKEDLKTLQQSLKDAELEEARTKKALQVLQKRVQETQRQILHKGHRCPEAHFLIKPQARLPSGLSDLSDEDVQHLQAILCDRTVHDFDLGEPLQEGRNSVFKATHGLEACVLKVVDTKKPGVSQLFWKTMLVYARYPHPNVVTVQAAFESGGSGYVQLPLCEATLATWRCPTLLALLQCLHAMASVVAFLHGRGVQHGAIKPSNFLVDAGVPLLSDFDLMRETRSSRAATLAWRPGGASEFLAPELVLSGGSRDTAAPWTDQADVYALGKSFERLIQDARIPEMATVEAQLKAIVASMCKADPGQRATAISVVDKLVDLLVQGTELSLMLPLPSYWTCKGVAVGTALAAARAAKGAWLKLLQGSERSALEAVLVPDAWRLQTSRRLRFAGGSFGDTFSGFRLAQCWRLEHKSLFFKFALEKARLKTSISAHVHARGPIPRVLIRPELDAATRRLHGEPLETAINEVYLLHGTGPEAVLKVLEAGVNERFSEGLFGCGTYFAEDAGKTDEYSAPDAGNAELFKVIYEAHGLDHPGGKVFYVLVCRVILGNCISTKDANTNLSGEPLWASSDRRELASITGSSEPHHGLVAEKGKAADGYKVQRYREFVQFHSDRVYPEYLVAYHRV